MSETPAEKLSISQRQTVAGTVVSGVRQPELTTEEKRLISEGSVPATALSADDIALLKKQSSAGVGGNPELTPAERARIIEINSRRR